MRILAYSRRTPLRILAYSCVFTAYWLAYSCVFAAYSLAYWSVFLRICRVFTAYSCVLVCRICVRRRLYESSAHRRQAHTGCWQGQHTPQVHTNGFADSADAAARSPMQSVHDAAKDYTKVAARARPQPPPPPLALRQPTQSRLRKPRRLLRVCCVVCYYVIFIVQCFIRQLRAALDFG